MGTVSARVPRLRDWLGNGLVAARCESRRMNAGKWVVVYLVGHLVFTSSAVGFLLSRQFRVRVPYCHSAGWGWRYLCCDRNSPRGRQASAERATSPPGHGRQAAARLRLGPGSFTRHGLVADAGAVRFNDRQLLHRRELLWMPGPWIGV